METPTAHCPLPTAQHPLWLAAALRKIADAGDCDALAISRPQMAPAFFVHPLPHNWVGNLFDTHPPIAERIRRLERMKVRA